MNTSLFTFIDGLFDIVGKIGTSLWEILTTPVSEYVATWNLSNVFGDGVIGNWISQIIETVLTFLFGENGTILSAIPVMIGIILIVRLLIGFIRG